MAEAHSAGAVGASMELRSHAQRSFYITEDGATLRCACFVPRPALARRLAARSCTRAAHDLSYALYPFSYLTIALVVAAALVWPAAGEASWAPRSTRLAALWGGAVRWAPALRALPAPLVALLAAASALALLSLLQRHALSCLLRYKGWLSPAARAPSLLTRAWFGAVQLLTRGSPMTYSFQAALPRQPVPPLAATVAKFLESAALLQDAPALARTRAQAAEFLAGPGPRLQALLVAKSYLWSHYTTDWWERYVYLKGRSSLCINSNYYVLDSGNWRPTTRQCARGGVLLHHMGLFNSRLNNDEVRPIQLQGAIPLCMKQYERMFATSRTPGREIDAIRHWDASLVRHVAVQCRGSQYFLNLYAASGRLRSPRELEGALEGIVRDAGSRAPRAGEAALAALTALPRTRWAEVRGEFFGDGQNRRSLDKVESALLWVHLDDGAAQPPPSDWTARARRLIHGDAAHPSVWFDKSISLTLFTDGHVGVNAEHAWADAPVVAHLMEEAIISAEQATPGTVDSTGLPSASTPSPAAQRYYDADGHAAELPAGSARGSSSSSSSSSSGEGGASASASSGRAAADAVWGHIPWSLPAACEEAVGEAQAFLRGEAANFDCTVVSTKGAGGPGYGKDFIKQCGVSPDAFVQAAMQLAYWRDTAATDAGGRGRFEPTYESSMTRLFLHGRTETVRPVTRAMCAFVEAMVGGDASPGARLAALQAAAAAHVAGFQDAMCGRGIDRHLFGLYCVSAGWGVEAPFLGAALSMPWKLSTSQQPQQQTTLWDIKHPAWADRISPGGGFGPVAADGYGVSYMVSGEREIFFHISARKLVDGKPARTSVARFQRLLFEALKEMKDVLSLAITDKKKEAAAGGGGGGGGGSSSSSSGSGSSSKSD